MNNSYLTLSGSIGICSIGLLAASSPKLQEVQRPNIIFILTDDLGYGDLSVQGGIDIHTPNIDKLFEKGITFLNAYANCTVCSPTRASLLTGCYPDLVGVPGVIRTNENNSWGYFLPDAPTLPEMLKSAGYQTALIGKWHLGLESPNLPNEKGFDFFHGFLGDMMDNYWNHQRDKKNYMRLNKQEINPEGHATDLFSQWAVNYIATVKSSKNPFFLYLAYNAPHYPIQPPEDWYQKVLQREPGIDSLRAKNVALVEHLDHGIGLVIEALEKSGLTENTIVVFTSDNGGHLPSRASNGNLHGGKQDMYEGGIKVPACVLWPKHIKPGSHTKSLALTMDFYPTLCKIAGVTLSHQIDGISLLPTLMGETQETDNRFVFWMRREGGEYGGMCSYAARKGPFKLLQNSPFEPLQLFNLETDPTEQHPLSYSSEEFKQLKFQLSQHIRKSGNIPWQKNKLR